MTPHYPAGLFGNDARTLSQTQRPLDFYDFLEDARPENDTLATLPRPAAPPDQPRVATSVGTHHPNTNGKRTGQNHLEGPQKKMKVESRAHGMAAANGSLRTVARDVGTSNVPAATDAQRHSQGRGQRQQTSSGIWDMRQPPNVPSTGTESHARTTNTRQEVGDLEPRCLRHQTSHPTSTAAPPHPRDRLPSRMFDEPVIKVEPSLTSLITHKALTVSGPFVIDSDDEDVTPAKEPTRPVATKETKNISAYRPQLSKAQMQRQLDESRRRRQMAEERKRASPFSFRTRDGDGGGEVGGGKEDSGKDQDVRETIMPRSQSSAVLPELTVRREEERPVFQFPQTVPAEIRKAKVENAREAKPVFQYPGASDTPPRALSASCGTADLRKAGQKSQHCQQTVQWGGSKNRRERERLGVAWKRDNDLREHVKALDEQEKKQAESRKVADARAKERARIKEQHDQQLMHRAVAAERSRAKVETAKKIELEQEAQAKQREQNKRRQEEQDWAKKRKAQQAHRETLRRRQTEAEKDKSALHDRDAALAKLAAMCPPPPPPQPAVKHEGDINETPADHTVPQQGLHFKSESTGHADDAVRKRVKEIQHQNARTGLFETKVKSEPTSRLRKQEDEKRREAKTMAERNESRRMEGTVRHNDPTLIVAKPQERASTAGKTLNAEAMAYYLAQMKEEVEKEKQRLEMEAEEKALQREPSPITEGDYCHFGYQIQRREMAAEDMDDGGDFDENHPWTVCDLSHDNLAQANKKAAAMALKIPPSWYDNEGEEAEGDPELDYSSRALQDGCKLFSASWEGMGKVQVCTTRYVRSHGDRILPRSKDGWARKTVWHIYVRTITRTGHGDGGDDLFAEKEERDVAKPLDGASYTTLEQANAGAVRYFRSIAFESVSGNLTQREVEKREVEKQLLEELEGAGEDGEQGLFWREMEGPWKVEGMDGRRKVVVWVEEGSLRGPRNL